MSLIVSYIKPKPLTFFRHQHYLNKKKTKTLIGLKKKKKERRKKKKRLTYIYNYWDST